MPRQHPARIFGLQRARLIEFRHLFRRKREFGRGEIVIELLNGLGADDDAHHALALQKPRERDASDACVVSLGDRLHRVDNVVGALLVDRREIEHRSARIVVAALVARVFAREKSARERAPDHDAEALVLDQRHDLALKLAARDRIVCLHRLEAGIAALVRNAERLHDLPGGEVRAADRADEAAAHTIVERAQRLFKRRDGVEAVDLIEVDMIEAESFQAGRDLVHDVSARQADGVRPRPHPAANLGRDDDVLALDAKIAQSLANLNLGLPFGIDVGRIDEIDSSLKSAADELGGGDLIERPNIAPHSACAAAVKGHRAKTDFRNDTGPCGQAVDSA